MTSKPSTNPLKKLVNTIRPKRDTTQDPDRDTRNNDTLDPSASSSDGGSHEFSLIPEHHPLLPHLLAAVLDYQLTHGSLIKLVNHPETARVPVKSTVLAKPIGTSLVPTVFPKQRFEEAWDLQCVLQELFAKVACDVDFLYEVCKDCIADTDDENWSDVIITALWKIWETVSSEDANEDDFQNVEMGLCRGDWMLHLESQQEGASDMNDSSKPLLKQVEFNAIATAGISHSNIVSDMHNHLLRTGIYSSIHASRQSQASKSTSRPSISPTFPCLPPSGSLPTSNSVKGLADLLSQAHTLYGPPRTNHRTAVLMVVQHENVNIADERPIEYALWDQDVPCYRVEYREILERTWYPLKDHPYTHKETRRNEAFDEYGARYSNRAQTLLFAPFAPLSAHPDVHPSGTDPGQGLGEVFEISVIYYRSSLTAFELSPGFGFMIRLHLERSTAVKCPSVLGQLAASKKVQLALSKPGVLERFLPTDQADKLRRGNVKMYDLTPGSPGRAALEGSVNAAARGDKGEKVDLDKVVLKPLSTEGGSHNIFPPASNISSFYEKNIQPFGAEGGYMLMEMIRSPAVSGVLISGNHVRREGAEEGNERHGKGREKRPEGRSGDGNGDSRSGLGNSGLYVGDVVSELGVLGGVVYRRPHPPEWNAGEKTYEKPGKSSSNADEESHQTAARHSQSQINTVTLEILQNEVHGTTLKCKPPEVKEMNVIKGSGCFGTPLLVGWDEYQTAMRVP
jgi:glutathione synthase